MLQEKLEQIIKQEVQNLLKEKCWPGYEKKGMKTMFGKRVPNCVKKTNEEAVEEGWKDIAMAGGMPRLLQKNLLHKFAKLQIPY